MTQRMTGSGSGVLLRVGNLDAERYFFRDVLQLGEPLIDSGFWVEFAAPDGTRIVLEKSEAPYLEHSTSAACILLAFPDPAQICAALSKAQFTVSPEKRVHPGEDFYRTADPEGNVIYFGAVFTEPKPSNP